MKQINLALRTKTVITCCLGLVLLATISASSSCAQSAPVRKSNDSIGSLPDVLRTFRADQNSLRFKYSVPMSDRGRERFKRFYSDQLEELEQLDFGKLSQDGKVDYLLFRNLLKNELAQMELDHQKDNKILKFLPFAKTIVELAEDKEAGKPIDGQQLAAILHQLQFEIGALTTQINQDTLRTDDATEAIRASRRVDRLRTALADWYRFYNGYDPLFTWWVKAPYAQADQSLDDYGKQLQRMSDKLSGTNVSGIVGEPIGNEALIRALEYEQIPYSPAELVQIAIREFKWCDEEMAKASRELGFEDDWRAAQDSVKDKFVQPGEQPDLIRTLAEEAIRYIEKRNLVTIPPLCKETWRMRMMSPQRQKVSPYFLGGPTILVSYPTDTMDHPDKLMSLRGNNPHFSRAVVHHELIPGHHLQMFMQSRHRTYRRPFATPFWLEGWALYWEMRLWDLGFARSPEDRIGMLFWRKHRCARIIFSLSYHLNEMSADECIDFLVERVGHERNNSTAEVRRSIEGGYGPLYQAAYMLGGLQIRSLHEELVQSGRMPERDFHDAILQQNSIPIEMLRARLTNQNLTPDFKSSWRFAD